MTGKTTAGKNKRLLLALETSTENCSAALFDGTTLINQVNELSGKRHNEILPDLTLSLYSSSGLKTLDTAKIAVSFGPGSFTGLRVGLSFAKGFAMGVNAALIPVVSLDGMALKLAAKNAVGKDCRFICPITIARKGEVFGYVYELRDGEPIPTGDIFAGDEEILLSQTREEIVIGGPGLKTLNVERLHCASNISIIEDMFPEAFYIGSLAIAGKQSCIEFENYKNLEPLYLKEFTVKNRILALSH